MTRALGAPYTAEHPRLAGGALRGAGFAHVRHEAAAEQKVFIDYSGKKPHIVDPTTGKVRDVITGLAEHQFRHFTGAPGASCEHRRVALIQMSAS